MIGVGWREVSETKSLQMLKKKWDLLFEKKKIGWYQTRRVLIWLEFGFVKKKS